MIHPVWRQMAWTLPWAGFLVLSSAADVLDVHHSPVLHRQKRTWNFNTMLAHEELPPHSLPQKIGQLNNSLYGPHTSFIIRGEGANELFTVDKNGEIWLKAKLDREKKSLYTLTAEIKDTRTNIVLEKDGEFYVKVQDINDNAPVFSGPYVGSINERSRIGTSVLIASATDADDPTSLNGSIDYKLLNGTDYFIIDNRSGKISVNNNNLDRETQSQYKLIVQAADLGGITGGMTTTTTVIINIHDINDNIATFKQGNFHFSVKEDEKSLFKISTLSVDDRDEKQNKKPRFTLSNFNDFFYVELDDKSDGVLTLRSVLDYETKAVYSFTVTVTEDGVARAPDNQGSLTTAQVLISVIDVDEPPVFTQTEYSFSVKEGPIGNKVIGSVSARDPDKAAKRIRYSIKGSNCPADINSETGQLILKTELDRETEPSHMCMVTALETPSSDKTSQTLVNIKVLDINDNKPELVNGSNVYICESDRKGTIIGVIGATDKDEHSGKFRFTLAKKSSNFSLYDNLNNTASIVLTYGGFSTENLKESVLDIEISDGGSPPLKSITSLHISVCTCRKDRQTEYCKAYAQTGVSVSALVAILLCIVTILVIVILFVMRKRYQKETLVALGKSAGEIHEQLVTYDEEGGGEMDTNGYDVSILSSACLRPAPGQAVYAVAKKPPACKGDMAMMIEVKKDEADHDRDGIPYDTLHIYGYEGPESLAGSLSSLDSSSVGSNLDYDLLNNWGPRFRTLAELYGMDGSDSDSSY